MYFHWTLLNIVTHNLIHRGGRPTAVYLYLRLTKYPMVTSVLPYISQNAILNQWVRARLVSRR